MLLRFVIELFVFRKERLGGQVFMYLVECGRSVYLTVKEICILVKERLSERFPSCYPIDIVNPTIVRSQV